ncbi:MAG: HDOD domain-containing protein [Humidesulfovibrio sp.]|uniref:HDOD domain-containing protein n=1 Tax=Humidesulfovibrio sp. TaxID=2910988 RepID=UPI002734E64C|nr:HDOD domain-containing protein [Humidesulfovibrio sp.]MDP2847413.1 HDOD domain-containing protein [Humidesulfovibrio sp.]
MTHRPSIDATLALVDNIPAFSKSVTRVLHLASDLNCSARDLLEVVSTDPVLTMKVLRLVNSAYFGRSQKVTSVHQAMVTLGLNTLKNVALSLAMLGALPKKSSSGFDIDALWEHSLAVGLAARRLARQQNLSRTEAEDCFVAGLLHDVGKLVLAQFRPQEFADALDEARQQGRPLHEAERASIGVDHAELGAALARRWELPPALVNALAGHHDPEAAPAPMTDVIFAANQVAKRLTLGDSGDMQTLPFPSGLAERLGLDAGAATALMPDLGDELERSRILLKL